MTDIFEQLAVRSTSWNGYEREIAVKELLLLKDPRAIPILIERSNDWVKSIKDLAHNSLLAFLKYNPDNVVSYLPQIIRLRQKRRWDHVILIDSIIKKLVELAPDKLLIAIASTDNKLALIAFKICVEHELASVDKLFGNAILNRQLHTSHHLMSLADKLTDNYIDMHTDELLRIRYLPLKNKFIKRLESINPQKVLSVAKALMCNKDATIRSLGRKHLMLSESDAIHYYLNFLNKPSSSLNHKIVAVAELTTMQKMEALSTLKALLRDKEPKMRKCILNQLAILLGENAKSILTEALTDTDENVSRESARLCYKLGIVFTKKEILSLAAVTDRQKTLDNLLLVSKLQDRWVKLTLYLKLLNLYSYEEATIRRIQLAIARWWQAAYQGTGPIPNHRREEIRALILAGKHILLPYQFNQLHFMLETNC